MIHSVTSAALRVEIDGERGQITAVRNLARDLNLISSPPPNAPFRVELEDVGVVEGFDDFRGEPRANGLRLTWDLPRGLRVISDIDARGDDIVFRIAVENQGRATIKAIEYPIFGGIGRLGGRGTDELAHTHGTGMLFHDPVDLFEPDSENRRHLRFSPYPEGFAGSTMQFLAYYARGLGGFLIGTEDATQSLKWYSFFNDGQALNSSVLHTASRPEAGADLTVPYLTVVAPLIRGRWHEAGERYAAWALNQPWAQPPSRSGWLRERVGICTFGINARHDRAAWLNEIHRMAGTPVFHILGPNWAAWGHDYHNHIPRRREDWFPAVFSEANLATVHRNGDYWAPFEFDLLSGHAAQFDDPVLESRMVRGDLALAPSDPGWTRFPFMCAGTDYWRRFHAGRDARLVTEHDPDALYYDISVSSLWLECLAATHRHAPGGGAEIAEPFSAMYRETGAATSRAKGKPVPAGTEVIHELFVDLFDYYQARAEAGPYAPFEAAPFRDWILDGRAETIPLFAYVFGNRSPLRMDGWAKLSAESGDLFYWVAAQVVLNGGLLELNYEFSALEDIDGRTDSPDEHYYRFDERHYAIDPAKAAFVGEVARTRTGPANPFLANGRMLPAPRVEAPSITLPYYSYNIGKGDPLYDTQGEMTVPSALATAWQRDGEAIWLVANLSPDVQEVRVDDRPIVVPGRRIAVIEQ